MCKPAVQPMDRMDAWAQVQWEMDGRTVADFHASAASIANAPKNDNVGTFVNDAAGS